MATITFNNGAADGGKWSTAGNWDLGRIPAGGSGGDDVKIPKNLSCKLDTTGLVAKSVELAPGTAGADVGATLTCTTTANWDLTVYNGITTADLTTTVAAYITTVNLDMSSTSTYSGTLYMNGANTATGAPIDLKGHLTLKGFDRNRWTTTTDPLTRNTTTSVHVADATGWQSGDSIIFADTSPHDSSSRGSQTINNVTWAGGYLTVQTATAHNIVAGEWVWLTSLQTALNSVPFQVFDAPLTTTLRIAMADPTVSDTAGTIRLLPKVDIVTLSAAPTYDLGTSGAATISWTTGWGTGGAVVENHQDNCLCGNLSSNLTIRPVTDFNNATITINTRDRTTTSSVNDVLFYRCKASTTFATLGVFCPGGSQNGVSADGNVFYDWTGVAVSPGGAQGNFPCSNFQFYSKYNATTVFTATSINGSFGDLTDFCVYQCVPSTGAITLAGAGMRIIRPKVSGVVLGGAFYVPSTDGVSGVEGGGVWSCSGVGFTNTALCAPFNFDQTWLGQGYLGAEYTDASNTYLLMGSSGSPNVRFVSCPETIGTGGSRFQGAVGAKDSETAFYNRDNNPADQDSYMTLYSVATPVFSREIGSTNVKNAVSSLKIATLGSTTNIFTREASILVRGGEAATIFLYVKKNADYNNGTYTLPSATLSGLGIDPITASGTNVDDTWELLDLSYPAIDAPSLDGLLTITLSASSNTATGVVYFSGIPLPPYITRCRYYGYMVDETNPTRVIDPTVDVTYATASTYTGIAITWGTPSSIALSASQTFQKLVDYTSSQMIDNVDDALPITWAGVAGTPALFAQGDIDTTGYTLDGAGSLAMDDHILTGTSPFAFTYTGGSFVRPTGDDPTFSGGTLDIGIIGTYTFNQGAGMTVSATPTGAGEYDLSGSTFTGTLTFENTTAHVITVRVPAGTTTATSTPLTVSFITPTLERGLEFTGLIAGSFVKVFTTTTTTERFSTLSSGTTETWDDATSGSATVDYVIMKAGYLPIRVTGIVVTGAVGTGIQTVPIVQTIDRSYVASAGLTWAEIALDTTNKYVKLNDTSTVQNLYSFMIEQWIDRGGVGATGAELANVKFPVTSNGPGGFSLIDGWETRGFTTAGTGIANTTLTNLTRDGLRYLDTGGTQTSVWAAILTSGVPSGARVRYQQSDAGTTVDAIVTSGNMDELVHVYGDASHGNFDKRGYLMLKVQEMGYDQAETDVVALYGNLEDQLYVVGLSPTPNGVATGDPSLATAPTITQGTYTLDGQTYSVKIVDGSTANTGTGIMRWLRYNFETGGAFQSEDAFNWHDLVRTNGSSFKTVRGTVYGTATTKGVVVYQNDGTTLHPDFTLFTADNGTTYTPPATLTVSLSGFVSGTRIQIYDTANSVELFNDVVAATTKVYTETYTTDRTIRVRAAYVSGVTAKMFTEQNLGSLTSTVTSVSRDLGQEDDTVYNANGVDGSAVNTPDVIISITDAAFLVSVDTGSISLPTIYAYQCYWLFDEEGIRDEGSFITAIDTANYRFADFNIKNVSSPTAPLIITGGYATDFTTGDAIDIIDTTGGTIFLTPNHVIPYAAGAEATVAIVQSGLTAQGYSTTRAGKIDTISANVVKASKLIPASE